MAFLEPGEALARFFVPNLLVPPPFKKVTHGQESRIYYQVGWPYTTRGGQNMPMVKKSISVTDQQDEWIKAQIRTGHFGNESEVFRELIRERQIREEETADEIELIRAALVEGEKSGLSDRSIDEIWKEARKRHRLKNA